MICDKEGQVDLGRHLQSQLLFMVVSSLLYLSIQRVSCFSIFVVLFLHSVFQCHANSLNRYFILCYVDVVDYFIILVMCVGSNYSTWS